MATRKLLLDFQGAYGGQSSRAEVLRMLKEARALVENTARDTWILCSGVRIEALEDETGDPEPPP